MRRLLRALFSALALPFKFGAKVGKGVVAEVTAPFFLFTSLQNAGLEGGEGGGGEREGGKFLGSEVEFDEGADDLFVHDDVGEFSSDGFELKQ